MNKITITINSRAYTVVGEESDEYLRRICDYINEKVDIVLKGTNHVMGEKPLVLAALNICDEYFKLLDNRSPQKNASELMHENKELKNEIEELKKNMSLTEKTVIDLASKAELSSKMVDDAEDRIKSLQEEINGLETRIKKQRSEFAMRERELLDMLESK